MQSAVHLVHIGAMNELQQWMQSKELNDAKLAELTKGQVSRSQISRIRRGRSIPKVSTAKALEALTGIPWHSFVNSEAAS